MEWYAARTRSNHEAAVAGALKNRFPEVFFPTYRASRWIRSREVETNRPLFPGYVFLQCEESYEDWLDAKKTHGVVDLIGYDPARPEAIPEDQIGAVRQLLGNGLPRPHPYLRGGDVVCVTRGPLRGLAGQFVRNCDKKGVLIVSIDLLGQSVAVEVEPRSVEPC
ncbi:MAG: hypothetical protein HYT87_00780 [Nitrospirae bacterium]|nr:hypothetical protein [Nitrospirota bacterium]